VWLGSREVDAPGGLETFITVRARVECGDMTGLSEIQQLREEIQELRLLYGRLAKALIPEEKPAPGDLESIAEPDETVDKDEFLQALKETPLRKRGGSPVSGNR
jgi:hypothetical protein